MTKSRRSFFPAVTLASAAAVAGLTAESHAHDHGPASVAQKPSPAGGSGSGTGAGHQAGHVPAQNGAVPDSYGQFLSEMHSGMDKMMRDMHGDPPSGDPDVDFLAMMIPHHWGATEMARLVLLHGRDPLVREIAEKILATQISEIEGMRGRLASLKSDAQGYPSLTGNRG